MRAEFAACVPPVSVYKTQVRIIISESPRTHFGKNIFQFGFEKFSSSDSGSDSNSDMISDSCSDQIFIVKPPG